MNIYLKHKSSIFILVISLSMRLLILLLNHYYDLYLLLDYFPHILNFTILISIFTIINKKKLTKFIFYPLLTIFFALNLFSIFWESDDKNFCIKSPNSKHTIIIEECSFLLGGWSNFYTKEYVIFKRPIKHSSITTDDGYRPFSNNNYSLKWLDEDTVIINYGYGQGKIRKEETIHLNQK